MDPKGKKKCWDTSKGILSWPFNNLRKYTIFCWKEKEIESSFSPWYAVTAPTMGLILTNNYLLMIGKYVPVALIVI